MELKLLALGLLHLVVANPTNTLQDMQMVDDTVSVGTYVRAVRATAPENFKKSFEKESDGVIGYSRKKSGGGRKGYQHFDSYHKKAGDDYELETENTYGKDEEGQEGAHSHQNERKAEKPREKKPEAAEEDVEKFKDDVERLTDDKERLTDDKERLTDERAEIDHQDLKEGAPDGNGGVEAHGHDPNDYVLPEKYTYGSGEEYDF